MNVFELMASLGVDLSKYKAGLAEAKADFTKLIDDISQQASNISKVTKQVQEQVTNNTQQAVNKVEKAVDNVGKSTTDTGKKIQKDSEETGKKVKKESEESSEKASKAYEKMGEAAAKTFYKIQIGVAAVKAVFGAVKRVISDSMGAYGEYEQMVGGVEATFKGSADAVIANAQRAYKTAGINANQYMSTLTNFSAALLQSIADTEHKASQMTTEEMSAMLQQQLSEKEDNLDKQYTAAERNYDKAYDALEKSLDNEIEAYEKATDKKIDAINREYTEKLKIVDEEKYNRIKAIDAEIDAINDQAEQEKLAREQSEYEAKKAELLDTIQNSQKRKRREEAQKQLDELEQNMADKQAERARKSRIDELKEQKEQVKEEADAKKEALKEQQSAEVNAVKESEQAQLKAMKEAKAAQLKALKESNSDKLKELKKQYSEELKLAKQAAQEQLAALEGGGGVGDYTEEQYQKAAEIGDRAVADMADNASLYGQSIETLMQTYQSLAKGNYQVIDNLRLGYGGTKSELQRLIKDTSEMTDIQEKLGITVDSSSLSFDNIVNAISVMQEKLGISGNAAREAANTIQGSANSMKAAWDNLLIGLADDNADVKDLTDKFVETIVGGTDEAGNHINGFIDNILPRISQIIEQLPDIIGQIAQKFTEELPNLIPQLSKALKSLIKIIGGLLPDILQALKDLVVQIGKELPSIIQTLINFIRENISPLIEGLIELVLMVIETLTDPEVTSKLFELALTLILSLLDGIMKALPKIIEALPKIVTNIVKSLSGQQPQMIQAGIELFVSLVKNTPAIIAGIIRSIPDIIASILAALFPLGGNLSDFFTNAWEGIKNIFDLGKVGDFFGGVWNCISNAFSNVGNFFTDVFSKAWENVTKVFSATGETFSRIGKSILNGLSTVINNIIRGINQVVRIPFDGLNFVLEKIRDINIAGFEPFSWIRTIPVPQLPEIPMLAQGGVLKRGQVALLEGQGDEAVIPLSQNTEWIDKVADRLKEAGGTSNTYDIHIEVANMRANSKEDIDALAEILMQAITEKTARRRAAF